MGFFACPSGSSVIIHLVLRTVKFKSSKTRPPGRQSKKESQWCTQGTWYGCTNRTLQLAGLSYGYQNSWETSKLFPSHSLKHRVQCKKLWKRETNRNQVNPLHYFSNPPELGVTRVWHLTQPRCRHCMRYKHHSNFSHTALRPHESLAQNFFLLYVEMRLVWLSFPSPELSSLSKLRQQTWKNN